MPRNDRERRSWRAVTCSAKRRRDFRYTPPRTATAPRTRTCRFRIRRLCSLHGSSRMAKPNYQFDKRQRDLAKKKKQDAKRLKKLAKNEKKTDDVEGTDAPSASTDDAPAVS
jgi:hypothetical protein